MLLIFLPLKTSSFKLFAGFGAGHSGVPGGRRDEPRGQERVGLAADLGMRPSRRGLDDVTEHSGGETRR